MPRHLWPTCSIPKGTMMSCSQIYSWRNAQRRRAKWRQLSIAAFFALSINACSTTPSGEPRTQPPENHTQPPPTIPDTPPIAAQSSKSISTPTETAPEVAAKPRITNRDQSIFFPSRSATVDNEEKEKLKECANRLKINPKKHVLLASYSDNLGSKSYNLAIAEQRIAAVSSALRALGVKPRQIRRNRSNSVKTASHACQTEECRQQMRRVEFLCGV